MEDSFPGVKFEDGCQTEVLFTPPVVIPDRPDLPSNEEELEKIKANLPKKDQVKFVGEKDRKFSTSAGI